MNEVVHIRRGVGIHGLCCCPELSIAQVVPGVFIEQEQGRCAYKWDTKWQADPVAVKLPAVAVSCYGSEILVAKMAVNHQQKQAAAEYDTSDHPYQVVGLGQIVVNSVFGTAFDDSVQECEASFVIRMYYG